MFRLPKSSYNGRVIVTFMNLRICAGSYSTLFLIVASPWRHLYHYTVEVVSGPYFCSPLTTGLRLRRDPRTTAQLLEVLAKFEDIRARKCRVRGIGGYYESGRQRNQWFESRNELNKDDRRFDRGYQLGNRVQSENFSRGDRRNRGSSTNFSRKNQRQGGRLNVLKVRDDQNDQSQSCRKNNGLPPDNPETYQFAVDYRKLNAITKYPRYLLPLIDDLITNIPVRFTRKFKNLYKWYGHRGESERRRKVKKKEGREQHGGARGHSRMSGIVITLRWIETKWR
ncbi:hypothetical protein TNCV_2109141 [Trichonephila clavipes]|nr:hypothetical protein TNCV_2109141 [Trichonephila clavipes]